MSIPVHQPSERAKYDRAAKRAVRNARTVKDDIATKGGLDRMEKRLTAEVECRTFAPPKT